MAKRGKSIREIAKEVGRKRRTVARVLREPAEQPPATRRRPSTVDPYRPRIEQWIAEGLTVVRMLELARADAECPYTGSRSHFGEMVRRVRRALDREQAAADVPIRFEGLPAEYLQVDWGEIRAFPFTQQAPATRYFLACRLKYSRWTWLCWTTDMRQETLFRGLVDCVCALGWVPWVLVFDNMKTVTSGRDAAHQPIWTPALLQLAGEYGFHPQACDPGAGNQKGKVERTIDIVKHGFWPGMTFGALDDLNAQAHTWCERLNTRVHRTTRERPLDRLAIEALTPLPAAFAWARFAAEERRVSWDGYVSFDGVLYGLPAEAAVAGGAVQVRDAGAHLTFWQNGRLLVQLPKGTCAGEIVTHPEQFHHVLPAAALRRVRQPLAHQHAGPVVTQRPTAQYDALCGVEGWA